MQQALKPPPGSARTRIVPAEHFDQVLLAVDYAYPRFTSVSEGKPRRRLLVRSKGERLVVVVPYRGASYRS
jgi:hypothetical protein